MHRALDSRVEAVPDTDAVVYLERTGLTSLKRLRSLQKSTVSYLAVRTDGVLQSNPPPFSAFSTSSRIEPSSSTSSRSVRSGRDYPVSPFHVETRNTDHTVMFGVGDLLQKLVPRDLLILN
jgi:hypothetical protein